MDGPTDWTIESNKSLPSHSRSPSQKGWRRKCACYRLGACYPLIMRSFGWLWIVVGCACGYAMAPQDEPIVKAVEKVRPAVVNIFTERIVFTLRLNDGNGLVIHKKQIIALGISQHQCFFDSRRVSRNILIP